MTDMVIPPEAVEAAADAITYHPGNRTGTPDSRHPVSQILARVALEAALPHLRPLFETATKVALELGRKEALAEIASGVALSSSWQLDRFDFGYVDVRMDKALWDDIQKACAEGTS